MNNDATLILAAISHVDASPEDFRSLVDVMHDLISNTISPRDAATQRKIASLRAKLEKIPVKHKDGSSHPLRSLVEDLFKSIPREILDSVGPADLFKREPFRSFFDLAVLRDKRNRHLPSTPRLRDFVHRYEARSERKVPLIGLNKRDRAGTVYANYGCLWDMWFPFVEYRYAHTQTVATGADACVELGGEYVAALHLCEYVRGNVTSKTPNYLLWLTLGGFACNYVDSAPPVTWPAYKVDVCVGPNEGALYPSVGDPKCLTNTNIGNVSVQSWDFFPIMVSTAASHEIWAFEQSEPLRFMSSC